MSERYEVAPPDIENPYLYRVVDHEDDAVVSSHPSWSQAHTAAAALNNPRPAPPSETPAPCCDCRERMERYRVALNKIARHSDDEYARRSADDALFGGATK